jgi:hypothetical protein
MPARPPSPPARLLAPSRRTAVALALLAAAASAPARGAEEVTVELRSPDGDLWSFPDLFDADGKLLARGTLRQRRTPSGHVDVELVNTFPDGRRVIQAARFDERGPNLVQETMRFEERRGNCAGCSIVRLDTLPYAPPRSRQARAPR